MCSVAGEMLAEYRQPGFRLGRWRANPASGIITASSIIGAPMRARPCLIAPADHPPRPKKKVVFADDRGFSLTQVRMMTEPSNVPPAWTTSILTEEDSGDDRWEMCFSQPASDYIEFKKRLDSENVSLENVFVKERECVAIGTVKVRNLAFEKEVIIRATFDDWKTREEVKCAYVENGLCSSSGVTLLYDTFSFRIQLQNVTDSVEFCVCYRTTGREFWDSNGGKNYRLLRKSADPLGFHPRAEVQTERPPKPQLRPAEFSDFGDAVPYW